MKILEPMDAHLIAPLLSVGSKPMIFDVKSHGYDVVVLCAEEAQNVKTNALTFQIPLFDTEIANEQTVRSADLLFTVNQLVELRKQGKHILVTCFMGKNRSAFVAALVLVKSGWTAGGAIQRIRERRKLRIAGKALQNRRFEKIIRDYGRGR